MPISVLLPAPDGSLQTYVAGRMPSVVPEAGRPPRSRAAYAAVHVVADPLAAGDPVRDVALDWDATIAYRRHIWSLGLGVAEAMDTAQRGMGLDWPTARELMRRSLEAAHEVDGAIVCGIATDQLDATAPATVDAVAAAYEEQLGWLDELGGRAVIMASRALAACAGGPDDYHRLYGRVLSHAREPVILHWLGGVFDPALAGYWGKHDPYDALDVVVAVIEDHAARVDGVKVSLLDDGVELELRRRLPTGVRVYTGDDFNFAPLIEGDDSGHSHALLGIFDAIAPVAAAALHALDDGDVDRYRSLLAPTLPLARHIFGAPTRHYKTGLVLLAYLNGHQDHFRMVGGMESARSVTHVAELFRLADQAGLLADAERAVARLRPILALAGIDA